jgi:Fe-S-cluster containining protein
MAEPATITLANGGEPVRIPADRVYLAFPNGRFAYDCIACGAKCCRGSGYEVLAGAELDWQLGTQHAVRFFLDPCDSGADDHFHARNWKPSCFFLDRQGLCTIQTQHGFDAKPETCRLFPFNNLRRVADYLIVGPHTGLCPLQVLPAGEHSDASDHGQLLASLEAVGVGTHVPVVDASGVDVSQLVALERRIIETCERPAPGQTYASHAAGQMALTRLASGAVVHEADARAAAEEEIDRFLRLVYEILGVAPPASEAAGIVFLKLIARRVGGRLVPIEQQGSFRDRLRQPRATALQWTVGHLSHDVLMVAAERANRRKGHRGAKPSASTSS